MRTVFWMLSLFAIVALIVLAVYYNSGSVLFTIPPYTVEFAFNTFIIVMLFAFGFLYVLLRMLTSLLSVRNRRAEQLALSSLKAFFETRYNRAGKAAQKAFQLTETQTAKALNAVIAARSAHRLGNFAQRDALLAEMSVQTPTERKLKLITEAELMLDTGRHVDALSALESLTALGGLKNSAVLQLELKAKQMAEDWDAVLVLTEKLAKQSSVDSEWIKALRHCAHLKNIQRHSGNAVLLKKYWDTLSSQEKLDGILAAATVKALMVLDDNAAAQKIIENGLSVAPYPELIALYADCRSGIVSWQIQRAESWLTKYSNNAGLLLTLGRLCIYAELWGKAQSYLEASLSIEPSYQAHLALAQLLEKLGQHESASEHFHKGLNFALEKLNSQPSSM